METITNLAYLSRKEAKSWWQVSVFVCRIIIHSTSVARQRKKISFNLEN
jgi:hypothetical protein